MKNLLSCFEGGFTFGSVPRHGTSFPSCYLMSGGGEREQITTDLYSLGNMIHDSMEGCGGSILDVRRVGLAVVGPTAGPCVWVPWPGTS